MLRIDGQCLARIELGGLGYRPLEFGYGRHGLRDTSVNMDVRFPMILTVVVRVRATEAAAVLFGRAWGSFLCM